MSDMAGFRDDAAARRALWRLLGGAPFRQRPRLVARQPLASPYPGTTLERLVLDLNGAEEVPALLLKPEEARTPPPLVLYAHAHGDKYEIGKSELLDGRPALQRPSYGRVLAEAGYAVLAIDNWLFGERPRHGGENAFAKARLLVGDTVWGMMLRDNHAAVTFALQELDIDPGRIAIMGLSMGASLAWWLCALDPRIAVCVDLCCMTDFHAAIDSGGLDGHGFYYSVPGLLRRFDTASINALTAPRPHLSLNGRLDPLTPEAGLRKVDGILRRRYAEAGAADRWRLEIHDCGHQETAAMRRAVLAFLQRWL
jgi:pimeloyl-ACP methyl ester carboxylesterase